MVARLADLSGAVRFPGLVAPGCQAKMRSHRFRRVEAGRIVHGHAEGEAGDRPECGVRPAERLDDRDVQ